MKNALRVIAVVSLLSFPGTAWAVSDCCIPHAGTGCDDQDIETCVCVQDDWCCSEEWDEQCVQEVEQFGCGSCSSGDGCGDWACNNDETCWTCQNDCGGCVGECCEANGTPGCWEKPVMDCVCAMDGFCCLSEWDETCAAEVVQFGCDTCPGQQPFCGDGNCDVGENCDTCEMDCGECGGTGDCCQANGTPGCGDPGISACVCAQDSYCCTTEWDDFCVGLVEDLGCGTCGGQPDCGNGSCDDGEHCVNCPGDCGGCQGDCCQANGSPGCDNVGVANCVCENDAYCCTTEWDEFCVGLVEDLGCGTCGGQPGCGNGSCDDGEHCDNCPGDCGDCQGDCCQANGTPGCDDPGVTNCVCSNDEFCCTTEWDEFCVGLVTDLECGECDGQPNCGDNSCEGMEHCANCPEDCQPCAGDCCQPNGTPGCDSQVVAGCVCQQDAYCCTTEWDAACVAQVEQFECGECGGAPAGCGDSECSDDEHCANCADDCGNCTGGCCMENETPGCSTLAVAKCVCALDSYCCEAEWDDVCVSAVEQFDCGYCGDVMAPCGDSICVEGNEHCGNCAIDCGPCDGACCEANGTPGCEDPDITACVCEVDVYCCQTEWDDVCVGFVDTDGCGDCGGMGFDCGDGECGEGEHCASCPEDCGDCTGDCCVANDSPGCEDRVVAECVCGEDEYCCENDWDEMCVAEIEQFGCGHCEGGNEDCGDGACVAPEQCSTCAEDCGPCEGSCCQPHFTPGCDDAEVSHCVCLQDSFCCEVQWDEVCVEEVLQFECGSCENQHDCPNGVCEADESCLSCPEDCGDCAGWGDCCEAHGSPGCDDAAISACVCKEDSFCCETEWDNICVAQVEQFECGSCAGGPGPDGCGDGECGVDEDCTICQEDCGWCPGEGDCCKPSGKVGCGDPEIQACVCDKDDYCCTVSWDYTCGAEVESFGCGDCVGGAVCGDGTCAPGETCSTCPDDCGPCGGQGDCCEVHDSPGCDDPTVQACVCAEDSFCCESVWDDVCVAEVEQFLCGSCDGALGCGDGKCEMGEDCLTCPEDCGECAGEGCCEPHATAACEDAEIAACVCNQDDYCCLEEWDMTCVVEVEAFGCGDCGDVVDPAECGNGKCEAGEKCSDCPEDCGECPSSGDCCEAQETGGCNDPTIQSCVCQQDEFCCKDKWDQSCVENVDKMGCGTCGGACQPDCDGKECGGDGCGGLCGQCGDDQKCSLQGKCEDSGGCQPDCAGKQCGDDGCGGTCGSCPPGHKCHGGHCKQESCTPDCAGKQCGPDGCGGACGQCGNGLFCVNGHCKNQCKPDCHGKQCGDDGCGGLCGTCPPGMSCNPQGHCSQGCTPNCAGKQCGDDGCGGSCGDCPPNYSCNNGHCSQGCVPACQGKQCGDDGCGGTCGSCPPDFACNAQGHCLSGCNPDCSGKQCGDDGCGGMCGKCSFGQICNDKGTCEDVCVPDCLNKECGDDGCGGTCGVCGFGQSCNSHGACGACKPDCVGKVCGDDGCGGNCGTCPDELSCDEAAGQCVYSDLDPNPDKDVGEEPVVCPPGQILQYGSCIPIDGEDEDLPSSDGCGCVMGPTESPAPPYSALVLFLLLGFALQLRLRRRSSQV